MDHVLILIVDTRGTDSRWTGVFTEHMRRIRLCKASAVEKADYFRGRKRLMASTDLPKLDCPGCLVALDDVFEAGTAELCDPR